MSWGVDLTEERLCCFIGTAAKVHVLASGIGGTLIREGFDVRCRFCRRKVDVLRWMYWMQVLVMSLDQVLL